MAFPIFSLSQNQNVYQDTIFFNEIYQYTGDTSLIEFITKFQNFDYSKVKEDFAKIKFQILDFNGRIIFEKYNYFFDKNWLINYSKGYYIIVIYKQEGYISYVVKV